jgi:hypothetical protein
MKKQLIFLFFFLISISSFAQNADSFISIKTNHGLHQKFGLKYPVTLEFKLFSGQDHIVVSKWNSKTKKWSQLQQKRKTNFFNGIETYRLDLPKKLLYVSVSFEDESDSIAIKITGPYGIKIPFKYIGFTKYYDNRAASIIVSADDWEYASKNSLSLKAFHIIRSLNLWLTLGVISSSVNDADWNELQAEFDSGFIEIASHSFTHPHIPYVDADPEIAGSKTKILMRTKFSGFFASNNQEFLYCWFEPYGETDSLILPILAKSNYLIDRSVQKYFDSMSNWNKDIQMYDRLGFSVEMGDDLISHSNITLLNDRFDYVFSNHGVYHLNIHPEKINWKNDGFAVQHLKYISNRKDAWYVSLGLLYVYNLTIQNSTVLMIRF